MGNHRGRRLGDGALNRKNFKQKNRHVKRAGFFVVADTEPGQTRWVTAVCKRSVHNNVSLPKIFQEDVPTTKISISLPCQKAPVGITLEGALVSRTDRHRTHRVVPRMMWCCVHSISANFKRSERTTAIWVKRRGIRLTADDVVYRLCVRPPAFHFIHMIPTHRHDGLQCMKAPHMPICRLVKILHTQ